MRQFRPLMTNLLPGEWWTGVEISHHPPGVQHKEVPYWACPVSVSTWKQTNGEHKYELTCCSAEKQ